MYQTPNRDALYLAVMQACKRCEGMGVSLPDFFFVLDVICQEYEKQRSSNPLASMHGD